MKKVIATFIIILIILITGIILMVKKTETTRVKLETNYGNITINLYSDMPVTSGNFKKLVESGFYDKVIFHRVIDGFMIQGGGFQVNFGEKASEPPIINEAGNGLSNKRGTISMARRNEPNSASCQFFINLVDNSFLDSKHPAFGKVIEGMDVMDKIAKVETDDEDRPLEDVVIVKASIIKSE